MGTAAAAEGLNLMNVRHIHITEPHWNPARHDQVIGRGIRLCSHATRQKLEDGNIIKEPVPVEERTIAISFYVTVFSEAQKTTSVGFNIVPIRRTDTRQKFYNAPDVPGARPPEDFMSSDEFLYEISYEKSRITSGITRLLKQAAVDCEIVIRIPKHIHFDNLLIHTEDEDCSTFITFNIRNGFEHPDAVLFETILADHLQKEITEVVKNDVNDECEIDSYWEDYSLSRESDFTEDGDDLVAVLKKVQYSRRYTTEKDVEINLQELLENKTDNEL